jgi:hypothetical protein
VGILLNEHVVLPFIDIGVLSAPHDGLWLLQGVKISISTVRNVNIEFISPYSTKQRLLSMRLIVIDSNLSTT